LTDEKRKNPQREKKALALVWACKHFYVNLRGIRFKPITDHKPLEVIFAPRSQPRIESRAGKNLGFLEIFVRFLGFLGFLGFNVHN